MASPGTRGARSDLSQAEVKDIRADFPMLAKRVHGKPLVYLDSAATSQKPRQMIDRLARMYRDEYARPEEGHELSKRATKSFDAVREQAARLINAANAREVVFCRGATEAINIVAGGLAVGPLDAESEILVTQAEHSSNILPWMLHTNALGATLRAAPIDERGDIDIAAFEELLTERTVMVAINHVSNVTGAVCPVEQMTTIAKRRSPNAFVLVDGAQAVPHLPVDVHAIGCDFYVGSGHKMGGPSSLGFFWGRFDVLSEFPVGHAGSKMADQVSLEAFTIKPPPDKFESGEPAFGEVIGWGGAIEYWTSLGLERIAAYSRRLATTAARELASIERIRVVGAPRDRVAVVSFAVDGIKAGDVEQLLDRDGIEVRAGTLESQPQLAALGFKEAVRASFSFYNTEAEVSALVEAVKRIAG